MKPASEYYFAVFLFVPFFKFEIDVNISFPDRCVRVLRPFSGDGYVKDISLVAPDSITVVFFVYIQGPIESLSFDLSFYHKPCKRSAGTFSDRIVRITDQLDPRTPDLLTDWPFDLI